MRDLNAESFEKLLDRLDPSGEQAGRKYEDLRLKILKFLLWQGSPHSYAEGLVDTTIDRIASKISDGELVENINAYAVAVARFVWLEFSRKHKEDPTDDFTGAGDASFDDIHDSDDPRMGCLNRCLSHLGTTAGDRQLIVGYYDTDSGAKVKEVRRKLAESLGIEQNALRVRACRLRTRLESCITDCVGDVTKTPGTDTRDQGARI